ncbi:MAG: hypothetical protein L0154_09605 [Chloroflexi bacterium]|nr:hypothetical protein [Chloroflexota bacterium]
MTQVDLQQARNYVCQHGTLWERALFALHFDDGPLSTLHNALRAYKNADNGYGNGLEPDLKCPDSNPLPVEFLLTVLSFNDIPPGDLLTGVGDWILAQMKDDGSLRNPPTLFDYPHAPWWVDMGGQQEPDSIVGNLMKFNACPPQLAERTKTWVQANRTIDDIRGTDWLFMNYHANDYFFNVQDFPELKAHRQATIDNIVRCAKVAPESQYGAIFSFARMPDHVVTKALPADLVDKALDLLASFQQPEGHWKDEHGLTQWYPYSTITNLLTLRRFNRLHH